MTVATQFLWCYVTATTAFLFKNISQLVISLMITISILSVQDTEHAHSAENNDNVVHYTQS